MKRTASHQHLFHDTGVFDSDEANVEARVTHRQTLMIQSHQVQDCGVKVAHVDRLVDSVPTNLIRRAVNDAENR